MKTKQTIEENKKILELELEKYLKEQGYPSLAKFIGNTKLKTGKNMKKVNKKNLKKKYTKINLIPGDSIEISNDVGKPITVWVEKREWSIFGRIINKII